MTEQTIAREIYDEEGLLRRVAGDRALARELLVEFGDEFADCAATLRHLTERGEGAAALHLVHALKGAAGNLGAREVFAAAAAAEGRLKSGGALDVTLLGELARVWRRWQAAVLPGPRRESDCLPAGEEV